MCLCVQCIGLCMCVCVCVHITKVVNHNDKQHFTGTQKKQLSFFYVHKYCHSEKETEVEEERRVSVCV